MNNAKVYLCKADCSILGIIGGIKTETCSLKRNATDLWEMTFEIERFVDKNGNLVQSDYYDSIDDMMRIYLDSDEIQVYFVIDSEPTISGDGIQEVKTVTCHSIESELNDVYLKNLKINCGTKDSQEYLVMDQNGEFINIDSYTGLPKEYISLVNYDNPGLSLMHIVLENTGWTVKDNIPEEVCNIKKSFETSDSIYSFLMKTVSPSASVIFEFDRKHKQIGMVLAEKYGKDTGVFVTMRNLMNSFEVTSSSEDNIITKLIPTGANNISVLYANFGEEYIINLDYFMNTLNEYGDYKFVSKDLHDKYNAWKKFRDIDTPYSNSTLTRRERYTELSRLYNKTLLDISELRNRVPNDGAVIDYTTFSLEELKVALTAYNKALVSLITVYKNEYGVTALGDAPDYTPTPSTATNIKDTPYWYDYYAYQERIIPQVTEALKMYCKTDSNGNLVVDNDGHYIELEYGNPDYYTNQDLVKNIDSYLYEWSLYGLDELEAKKKAWGESASILFKDYYIASGTVINPISYITVDDWDTLTASQKSEFTSKDAFVSQLNTYLDYMSFESRYNGITGTTCKGIIRQCEEAIEERKDQIASIESLQRGYQTERISINEAVSMKKFFTDKDIKIIESMLRQKEYSNENIITTNLDDAVSEIDKHVELYQEAIKELDKLSQPQYSFATELDNLYSLEEFKAYREPFDVGNFIRVGLETHEDLYENEYIKLRLMSIEHNPMQISEELSVEFSTMTKTLNTVSDLAFLLDKESSGDSSSSSSGSYGSGGTYGNNDADVQISNNMLNALLKTEMFGTTVSDVILDTMKANKGNFNKLFAHSGVFDSLEAGQIKVSGDCLFDRIKSSNWNGTDSILLDNTEGSVIDLSNGKFNFGGGSLKWDGSKLSVVGDIVANSLTLGNSVKLSTSNIDGLSSVATSGSYSDLSNKPTIPSSVADLGLDTSKIIFKGDITQEQKTDSNGNKYTLTTVPTSNGQTISYSTYEADDYIVFGRGEDGDNICISKEGLLTARNALIYGTIYATDGSFTGDIVANSLTLGNNVKVSTSNISGLSSVATSGKFNDLTGTDDILHTDDVSNVAFTGKYTDLTGVPSIPKSLSDLTDGANVMHFSDISFGTPSLDSSTGVTTQTITYKDSSGNSYNYTNKYSADGNYILTNVGKGTGSWSNSTDSSAHQNDYFLVSSDGLLRANNAIIYGDIYASNGRFSGDVIANTLTANTEGSIAGWKFNSTAFYRESDTIGNATGFYVGKDGISIGKNFITTPSGFLSQSTDYTEKQYIPRYFKNDYYNYPYYDAGEYGYQGDYVASYVIELEDATSSHRVYVKFKNPNHIDGDSTELYDDSVIEAYTVTNGKLILTTSNWFGIKGYYTYLTTIYKPFPRSIIFGDVHEVWADTGIKNIKVYTGGNATGTTTDFKYKYDTSPINVFTSGMKIDTINSNIITKNYCLNSNGINFTKINNASFSSSNLDAAKYIYFSMNTDGIRAAIQDYDNSNNLILKDYIKLDNSLENAKIKFTNNDVQSYLDANGITSTNSSVESYFGVNGLCNTHIISKTVSSGSTLRVDSDGYIWKYSSSSERYKDNMTTNISEELNPHKLYNVNIYDFKYKKDYLSPSDQRYDQNIIGFKAEQLYEEYPIACNLDEDGKPEVPEYNILIAPMLKLIQEQHEDIEKLKEEIKFLKETVNGEVSA